MLSTLALTSTFVALAASAPLAKRFVQAPEYVFGDSYLSNATFGNFIAKEYAIKDGSCNLTNFDTDYVVSVKTNHTNLAEVCNMQINVTNKDNGKWVLATIVDECLTCSYNYLLLSPAAYEKVASSSDSNFTATYTFSNYQAPDTSSTSGQGQTPAAPQKQDSSSSSTSSAKQTGNNNNNDYKPSTSSSWSSSSKQWQPESSASASSKSAQQEQENKPEYSTSTSSSKYYAPPTTSTSWTPEATTSSTKWVETTKAQPTTTWTQQQQTYTPQKTTTQQQQQSSYSGGQFSGRATYFYQGGNPGSCGAVNSDSAYIVAVNAAQMNGGLCGRSVRITNTANGQSITASVADTCPGCGYGSLDLSVGAFQSLGSLSSGVLPISWSWA